MKRIIALVMCTVMLFTLASCGGKTITSKDDLSELNIGMIKNSKSTDTLSTYRTDNNCEFVKYATLPEIDNAFNLKDIDCAVLDRNVANSFVADYAGYTVLEDSLGNGAVTFATTSKIYKIMLNKALAALKENGTIDSILNSQFKDKNYKYVPKELENDNGEFVIALDVALTPYCENDGEYVTGGIALSILDAVCEYLGCNYSVLPTTTENIAKPLKNGTADFALGDFITTTTNETKEIFETEPVITFDYAIVTKK